MYKSVVIYPTEIDKITGFVDRFGVARWDGLWLFQRFIQQCSYAVGMLFNWYLYPVGIYAAIRSELQSDEGMISPRRGGLLESSL